MPGRLPTIPASGWTTTAGRLAVELTLVPVQIATPRLVLAPASRELAAAVVAGDLSGVAHAEGGRTRTRSTGSGWLSIPSAPSLVWLVTLDGVVIGDCGTVGLVDAAGEIEIGYGLAAEHRGFGLGTELVVGLSGWLLAQRAFAGSSPAGCSPPTRRRGGRSSGRVSCASARRTGLTWYGLDARDC